MDIAEKTDSQKLAKADLIINSRLFGQTPSKFLYDLADHAYWRRYNKGQTIFTKGDPATRLYFVGIGTVEIISVSEGGKEIVFDVMARNEAFGQIGFFGDTPRTADAKSLSETMLLCLDRTSWVEVSKSCTTEIWNSILSGFSELLARKSSYIENMCFLDTKARLISLFVRLVKDRKQASYKNNCYYINISQQKLAFMLGVSREIVNKVLASMEKEGSIIIENRQIIIPDILSFNADISMEAAV